MDGSEVPGWERRLERIVTGLSTVLARVAGFALLGTALLITAEVLARKLIGASLVGADEIAGYVLAISVAWGLSLAVVRRAHVRIDVVYNLLPRHARALLDLLALAALAAFVGLWAWFAARLLATNWAKGAVSNTPMEVPKALPQAFWVAGLGVFLLVCLALMVLAVASLRRGDTARAGRIAGVRGALEEAREETVAAEARGG